MESLLLEICFFSGVWTGFFNIFTLPLAWTCKRCFSRSFAKGIFSLIFISFRIAEWVSKQAEREREKEIQKQLRMERKRQMPKHTFDDATYTQHIQETCERIEDALQQGKTFSYFHICCSCCSLSFINKKLSFGNHQQPLCYCPLVTIRINTHPFLPSTHQFFYLSLLVLLILKARLWPQATRRS